MRSKINNEPLKKLRTAAFLSVVITFLLFAVAFCFFFADIGGKRNVVEIPELVGREFNGIGELDRIILESEPIFSHNVPEGVIVSQSPYGGAQRKLAEGEKYTVRVTVSMGKETSAVPYLEGMRYNDAAAALRSIGAKIKIVPIYGGERDAVIRTLPKSGEMIEKGDTVTLFVGRTRIQDSVLVKDFTGNSKEEAIASILVSGLSLGEITQEKSGDYPVGCVISQSILPGSRVLHGTKIDITINAEELEENLHPFRKDMIQKDGELNE